MLNKCIENYRQGGKNYHNPKALTVSRSLICIQRHLTGTESPGPPLPIYSVRGRIDIQWRGPPGSLLFPLGRWGDGW